jgi:deazaflavin-dependent oxidoreductase (nitroreductase family)
VFERVGIQINNIVEGIVRAGIGSPLCAGIGLVIIETKGRKTGQPRSVPVLAQRFRNTLFVSTVRADSQWVRNLRADDSPAVIVGRRSQDVVVTSRQIGRWSVLRLDITGPQ